MGTMNNVVIDVEQFPRNGNNALPLKKNNTPGTGTMNNVAMGVEQYPRNGNNGLPLT